MAVAVVAGAKRVVLLIRRHAAVTVATAALMTLIMCGAAKVKVKVYIYSPISSCSLFTRLYTFPPQVLELTLARSHSLIATLHCAFTVPPGTHYCWVARDSVG